MEKMMQRTIARFCVLITRKLGHYSSKCSEGNNKANTQGSVKKEHYARRCTKEDTPGL
jgi:hypothetical protein